MSARPLTIGFLARATGTNIETIRYYEREGLLPPPERTQGNYRAYEPATCNDWPSSEKRVTWDSRLLRFGHCYRYPMTKPAHAPPSMR